MKKSLVVLALALALGTGSAAQAQVQDYVMCPGDVLQVVVYGHEDLSTLAGNTQNSPYVVRPDGKVSFPLIGDVDVTGKTVTQFREELVSRFGYYLVKPQISVNVVKLGTTRVYVLGEVKRPGLFELEKSHRVLDALAKAEGFTEKSAKRNVFLVRAGSTEVQQLNINNYLRKADLTCSCKSSRLSAASSGRSARSWAKLLLPMRIADQTTKLELPCSPMQKA